MLKEYNEGISDFTSYFPPPALTCRRQAYPSLRWSLGFCNDIKGCKMLPRGTATRSCCKVCGEGGIEDSWITRWHDMSDSRYRSTRLADICSSTQEAEQLHEVIALYSASRNSHNWRLCYGGTVWGDVSSTSWKVGTRSICACWTWSFPLRYLSLQFGSWCRNFSARRIILLPVVKTMGRPILVCQLQAQTRGNGRQSTGTKGSIILIWTLWSEQRTQVYTTYHWLVRLFEHVNFPHFILVWTY